MPDQSHGGITVLSGVSPGILGDLGGLSGALVAAAGAIGLSAYGPPVVRSDPTGLAICLLCRQGHVVLHASLPDGVCIVDILAPAGLSSNKGIEVLARRLSVSPT